MVYTRWGARGLSPPGLVKSMKYIEGFQAGMDAKPPGKNVPPSLGKFPVNATDYFDVPVYLARTSYIKKSSKRSNLNLFSLSYPLVHDSCILDFKSFRFIIKIL